MSSDAPALVRYQTMLLAMVDRARDDSVVDWPSSLDATDIEGSRRAEFTGLSIYHLMTHPLPHQAAPVGLMDTLLQQVSNRCALLPPMTSDHASLWCEMIWKGLALIVSRYAKDGSPAYSVWQRIRDDQQPSGAFFQPLPSTHPETLWYYELVMLHAVSASSILNDSPRLRATASRNAAYHLNFTQPDHATALPWGLPAFIINPETHTLADQMLHTVQTQPVSCVTLMLLADTLYLLDRFATLQRNKGDS